MVMLPQVPLQILYIGMMITFVVWAGATTRILWFAFAGGLMTQ
jgi:hypothetical protein